MSSSKKIYSLGHLVDIKRDVYRPSDRMDLPYIGLEHIEQGSLRINGMGSSLEVTSNKFYFRSGDILFGKLRPYFRKVVMLKFDGVCSTDIWVLRTKDPKVLDQKYLFYLMASDKIIEIATSTSTGTRMPRADWAHLRNLEIELPDIKIQKKIADILSSLDEKIELNNQINKNLEEMAQAIFKSWFTDFEPFQDGEFVESELGLIPKGWEIGRLEDIAELTMGLSPKSETYNEKGLGLPLLNGAADFNGSLIVPKKYTTDPKRVCDKGDIIFCIRATIGNVTYADRQYCLGRGVAALKPKKDYFGAFIYYNLERSIDTLVSQASGSVFLNLTKPEINNLRLILPPLKVMEQFYNLLNPLVNLIQRNDEENITLSNLRDTLLPKLMSGEIRVPLENEGRHQDEQLQRV